MTKIDYKKELKDLYNPPAGRFVVVDVPPMSFLMVDGHGDPNVARAYQDAVEALYSLAYKLMFLSKKELGLDYAVPPLEGLWWVPDMTQFSTDRKSDWDWTMMIMQPAGITAAMLSAACRQVSKGKNLPALSKVRLEPYTEGLSVQVMHLGPFSAEGPVLDKMHHVFMPEHGYVSNGKHHEIYLSDPRKIAPEKMRTVLRQPVKSR